MKKEINKYAFTSMTSAIILVVLGIVFYLRPTIPVSTVGYIAGGIIFLSGIALIINYFATPGIKKFMGFDLINGALTALLGILVIVNPISFTLIVTLFIGIWLIISGLFKLISAIKLKKYNEDYWLLILVMGLIVIFCGILLVVNPFDTTMTLTRLVGIFLIFYAILHGLEAMLFKSHVKSIEKIIKNRK